jgi:membrane protease YdiL (CAAX protease family)
MYDGERSFDSLERTSVNNPARPGPGSSGRASARIPLPLWIFLVLFAAFVWSTLSIRAGNWIGFSSTLGWHGDTVSVSDSTPIAAELPFILSLGEGRRQIDCEVRWQETAGEATGGESGADPLMEVGAATPAWIASCRGRRIDYMDVEALPFVDPARGLSYTMTYAEIDPRFFTPLGLVVANLVLLLVVLPFAFFHPWRDDLARLRRHPWRVPLALLLTFACVLPLLALGWALDAAGVAHPYLDPSVTEEEMLALARELFLYIAPLALGGAIAEELVFRGFLYRALIGVCRPWVVWLLSTTLFTVIHFAPLGLYPPSIWIAPGIFLMGSVLFFLRHRFDSLLLPILAHLAWNGALILLYGMAAAEAPL